MTTHPSFDRIVRWYPVKWRERYGDEFATYLADRFGPSGLPRTTQWSIALAGVLERVRYAGVFGESVARSDRVRAGVVTVTVAWTAMVVAGSSFAKMSEHFDGALGSLPGPRRLPDLAYHVVQGLAGLAALVVLGAVVCAVPELLRFVRSGGWPSIRAHAHRATALTLLTATVTAPLVLWAHHLNSRQRNGGLAQYSWFFIAWATLVVVTATLWTIFGVATLRRISLSRSLLVFEAVAALFVATAIDGLFAATLVWAIAVGERAPHFLGTDFGLTMNYQLAGTVALMALAAVAASGGALRVARSLPSRSPATTA